MKSGDFSVFATLILGSVFIASIFSDGHDLKNESPIVYLNFEPQTFVPERPKMICCRPPISKFTCEHEVIRKLIGRSINAYGVFLRIGCSHTISGTNEIDVRKRLQSGSLGLIVNEAGIIQKAICI